MNNLYAILIKDYGPHKKGEKYGAMDLESYKNLFQGKYIEDELGLMGKKETTKTKKSKKEETTKEISKEI